MTEQTFMFALERGLEPDEIANLFAGEHTLPRDALEEPDDYSDV